MQDYQALELQGAERRRVVEAVRRQVAAWGLTLPPGEPLPLHFGLGRFMEVGETEFWIANEKDAGYCGKFLFVFDGQTCPYHHHRLKHETFFVVKGAVRMKMGETTRVLREGEVLAMPRGVAHAFTGHEGPALVLEVSQPSVLRDNFFSDPAIGDHGVI